jgi:uncharacterized protein (DUF433 family)
MRYTWWASDERESEWQLTSLQLDPRRDLAVEQPGGNGLAANARHTWAERSARIVRAMNYRERIERNPHVVGSEAVLKGTRVTLRTVLASLAEGATTAEILADFPTLREEDVRAAIAFAATSAQEDLPVAESPIKR